MRFSGKKVVVTGAHRSIGKGIAAAFIAEGADVVVSYRSNNEGAVGKAIQADFSNLNGVQTFFDEAIRHLGTIDILVNNAADYDTSDTLHLDPEVFQRNLQVGAVVPLYLTQLAAKKMIAEGKGGSIINISSITGMRPYPSRVALASTKSALNMLTQCAALDLAKYNIRVNAIAPGSIPYDGKGAEEVAKLVPLKRAGLPEDPAKLALFLASDDASWITGQLISVDGGHALSF